MKHFLGLLTLVVGVVSIVTTEIMWLRIVASVWLLLDAFYAAYLTGQKSKKGVTKK